MFGLSWKHFALLIVVAVAVDIVLHYVEPPVFALLPRFGGQKPDGTANQ